MSPADKARRWREAPTGEDRGEVSGSPFRRGLAERAQESVVGAVKLLSDTPGRRMEQRCWRSLGRRRAVVRDLLLDGDCADRSFPRLLSPRGGFRIALADQLSDPLPPQFGRQMLPARQRRELNRVLGRVLEAAGFLLGKPPSRDAVRPLCASPEIPWKSR